MARMIKSGSDVVSFLKEQHTQIKSSFALVFSAQGEERAHAFFALRRLLAVHETAEEEIVHPAARRALPDGERIVEARLAEEKEAKKVLTELEAFDPSSAEFEARLRAFEKSVIAHAESEEQQEFERLGEVLDQSKLERMGKAAQIAEAIAPTRPHAGVESQIANLLVGPFAAMLDRSRDLLTGKTGKG